MIGIDFDNTIACYDPVFHAEAVTQGLVPADVPVTKTAVRDWLRIVGAQDAWTELQGHVYGRCMDHVRPFDGVLELFGWCIAMGLPLAIVSHKTRRPVIGPDLDLHAAALDWLEQWGFFDPRRIGLPRSAVYLEPTREAKLERMVQLGCRRFVDDLPELFESRDFPRLIEPILFDPWGQFEAPRGGRRVRTWAELSALLLPTGDPVAF